MIQCLTSVENYYMFSGYENCGMKTRIMGFRAKGICMCTGEGARGSVENKMEDLHEEKMDEYSCGSLYHMRPGRMR